MPGSNPQSDEEEIRKLFEDGDRAIITADIPELSRIYADDYLQYDEAGKRLTREDLIENATNQVIRYVAMRSTGRLIRIVSESIGIVHGSEEDEIEQSGRRFPARYIYMDVVRKRDGNWQIVASQLSKLS